MAAPYPLTDNLQERLADHDSSKTGLSPQSQPTSRTIQPIKKEWTDAIFDAKRRYIGTEVDESGTLRVRPHYNLDFLGRNPHMPRVPGAVSAVMVPLLGRAERDGMNVRLEAATEDLIPLYEHFGFDLLEEMTVGVGRVDAAGLVKKGGEGITGWAMMVDNTRDAK